MAVLRILLLLEFPNHDNAVIGVVANELKTIGEIKVDLEFAFQDADLRFYNTKGVELEDHLDLRHYGLKNMQRLQMAVLEYEDSDQEWSP